MRHLSALCLILVGIVHLLPLVGVLGGERLAALYGIAVDEPNLALLMRHRAVLFGLLGALLVAAAFKPGLRAIAFFAGFISVASFLWLAWPGDAYTAEIRRVFVIDLGAMVLLAIGLAAHLRQRRREARRFR